jgi:hypothetical protein
VIKIARVWIIEQKLFQLTIEAERQRQLCEGIKEVRETIDATICSSMRALSIGFLT